MPTLNDIRGTRIGQPAVVMGAGPSLRLLRDRDRLVDWELRKENPTRFELRLKLPDTSQPDRLQSMVTIAVNDAILKMPDCDYYITGDSRMPAYNHWRVVVHNSTCTALMPSFGLSAEVYVQGGMDRERLIIYERRDNANDWRLSMQDSCFLGELNSALAAVNLAVLLGCSPIYAIGCECRVEDGLKYFWEFPDQPGPGGTYAGHKTIWLESQASQGRKHGKGTYDAVFSIEHGKVLGKPGILKWKRLLRENQMLPVIDVASSEWNRRQRCPSRTVEEMLQSASAI